MVGEGEETLAELVASGRRATPGALPAWSYREATGGCRFTGFRDRAIDLDDPALPGLREARRAIRRPTSCRSSTTRGRRTPAASPAGAAPMPAATATVRSSAGAFATTPPTTCIAHLRYLKERFGIRHINFYDDQFTFNRKRVEAFCRMMIDQPLGMTFNCAVRAEHVDPELLRLMKAAGCWMISLGIETGDEHLLAQHRQNADLELLAGTIRADQKGRDPGQGPAHDGPARRNRGEHPQEHGLRLLPAHRRFQPGQVHPLSRLAALRDDPRAGRFRRGLGEDGLHALPVRPEGDDRGAAGGTVTGIFTAPTSSGPGCCWGMPPCSGNRPTAGSASPGTWAIFLKFARTNRRLMDETC